MGFNKYKWKICFLAVFLIVIICLFSISRLVYAQDDKNNQTELNKESKSWLGGILDFFKSLFNAIFQVGENKELSRSEGFKTVVNETGREENLTIEISNITNISNITCGYCQHLVNDTCLNYSCCKDEGCLGNATCSKRECKILNCSYCQHIENHSCISYGCCKDGDCESGEICENHFCVQRVNITLPHSIPFEKVLETGSYGPKIIGYNFPSSAPSLVILNDTSWVPYGPETATLAFSIITRDGDFDYIKNNLIQFPADSYISPIDFENNFLILLMGHSIGEDYFFITEQVTGDYHDISVVFRRSSSGREIRSDAESLLMVKKSDLPQRNNLNFIFIDSGNRSLSWTIAGVNMS